MITSIVERDALRVRQRRFAPWPYAELDATTLGGWRPTPAREFVIKVHQRCDLACAYCYVYTQPDQTWRDRPAAMSEEICRATAENLWRHVRRNGLTYVRVILHGGEPLLFGGERLGRFVENLRAAVPPSCTVDIGLQTNGVLLDADLMAVLRRHGISVGLSVDGPEAVHDRNRRRANGAGSFAAVRAAADLLRRPENRPHYAGLLCVVAPDTDPIACYEQLLEFEPPAIDFLLPHANWQHPPQRPPGSAAPYADWLIAAFDAWRDGGSGVRVKLFEDIIALLLGQASRSEQVGLSPAAILIVETDGSIEQIDALKSAYQGAGATGLDVRTDEFDAALEDPGIVARQIGRAALSDQCLGCPVVNVCGGGHYAHRYDPATGFLNPSVFCADMRRLIDHIRHRLEAEVRRLSAAAR
jgi:uncharacterized protein